MSAQAISGSSVFGGWMSSIKRKDRYSQYESVSNPQAAPESLSQTKPGFENAPPVYQDEDDEDIALTSNTVPLLNRRDSLEEGGEPPISEKPLPKKRRPNSPFATFCKLAGLMGLVALIYLSVKFAIWVLTPAPSGMENMPVFGESLPCRDAPHTFAPAGSKSFYSVPVSDTGEFDLSIAGPGVGTLILSTTPEREMWMDMIMRSSDPELLKHFRVDRPAARSDFTWPKSYMHLITPHVEGSQCMHWELVIRIPENHQKLKHLTIVTTSATQFKFDDTKNVNWLEHLTIRHQATDSLSLLQPNSRFSANNSHFGMTTGYFTGSVALRNSTKVHSYKGDALTNVQVVVEGDTREPAHLEGNYGSGRTDLSYSNPVRRPVDSSINSRGNADMYLQYTEASFNGRIELDAKAYHADGVHGLGADRVDGELPWVGSKDAGDILKVKTGGWVGLSF